MSPPRSVFPSATHAVNWSYTGRSVYDPTMITEGMLRTMVGVAVAIAVIAVAAGPTIGASLSEALVYIPRHLESASVGFTHWDAIKTDIGMASLTSDAPLDQRAELIRRTSQDHASGSSFAVRLLSVHADTWGFDTTDLAWEIQISAASIPPTYLLKLRDDFDLARLTRRFRERGFTQTASYGATLFSRPMDFDQPWAAASELAIHSTAVLEEESLLILSTSPEVVHGLLATGAGEFIGLDDDPAVTEAVRQLDDPFAAYLFVGPSTCLGFTPNPLLDLLGRPAETDIDELKAWFASGDPLLPYSALAVGYRIESEATTGVIALVFPCAESANHDFDARVQLAQSAASSVYEAPIAEAYFTVDDARLEERTIVLDVDPANNQPSRLFRMLLYRDAAFAACR